MRTFLTIAGVLVTISVIYGLGHLALEGWGGHVGGLVGGFLMGFTFICVFLWFVITDYPVLGGFALIGGALGGGIAGMIHVQEEAIETGAVLGGGIAILIGLVLLGIAKLRG